MRSRKLIIAAGILLTSCVSENSAPVIAAVDYQLFCVRSNGCNGLVSISARVVERAIDGQEGYSVNCSKGDKTTDLSLDFYGAGYGFSVESTSPGSSADCTISVMEGNNAYEKSCELGRSSEADCSEGADADTPCQVSVSSKGSTVSGTFCCRNIPEELKQPVGNEYSLVRPLDFTKPARFEFKNCK